MQTKSLQNNKILTNKDCLMKRKNHFFCLCAYVPMCLCAAVLLISCAEQQLVVNPEPTDTKGISASVTSFMKSSSSLLEGSEVIKENGKSIIKPKKRITLKEFIASQPYKMTLDNSIIRPQSAPCNYRWSYYYTLERFERMAGNKVGFFFTNTNANPSWSALRDTYGFSQLMICYSNYQFVKNNGWLDSEIVIRTATTAKLSDYYGDIYNPYLSNVSGFYSDEPFEKCNYNTRDTLKTVLDSVAGLIYPKKLILGSWSLDYIFSESYKYLTDNIPNIYIMSDQYKSSGGSLQSLWENFRNTYGNKNISNFMDVGMQNPANNNGYAHWDGLIPCARNSCNLNSIYLYSDNDGNGSDAIYNFCYYAWNNYFLRGFGKHYIITERCSSPNCEHCQDPEDPDGEQYWYLESIVVEDEWHERVP